MCATSGDIIKGADSMTAMKRRAFLLGTAGTAMTAILAACGGEETAATATRLVPTAASAATTVSGAATAVAPATVAATTAPTVAVSTAAATTAPTAAATAATMATTAPTAAPMVAGTVVAPATSGSPVAGTAATGAINTTGFAEATAAPAVTGMMVRPPMLAGRLSLKTLTIALVPGDDPGKFFAQYKELLAYLKQSLGVEVKGSVGTSYSAVIEAQRNRKIDLGFYGPFSYILARAETGADCFLQGEDKDGKLAIYNTLFIVPASSSIMSLADIRGKNFAFVDPASTSGFLVPASTIRQRTMLVEGKDYKFTYAGNHVAAVQAVVNDKADMASVASDIYQQALDEKAFDPAKVRVVEKSSDIPGSPIGITKEVSMADREVLLQAFLSINDQPKDSDLFKNFVLKGGFGSTTAKLRKGDDASYNELRKIPASLGIEVKGLVK